MPAMMAAMASNPVMTGRRMQSSEMFIPPGPLLSHAGDALRPRGSMVPLHRPRPLRHPLGAIHDHLLPGRQLAPYHGTVVQHAGQLHAAPVGGAVGAKDEDEAPLLP